MTGQAKAQDAPVEMQGTALASAADVLNGPRLSRGLADDSEPTDFRSGVVRAMTSALGRAPVTRQDAINATYRQVGWVEGKAPTDRQNRDAYHQACRWGFTLGQFNHLGRAGAFSTAELASEALDEHAHRKFTKGWTPEHKERQMRRRWEAVKAAARYTPMEKPRTEGRELTLGDVTDARGERSSRLDHLNARLEQLKATTRSLEAQVSELERAAEKPGLGAGQLKTLRRKAESLRELIAFSAQGTAKLEKEIERAQEEE